MKRVSIKRAASDEMPRDVEVEPGTTAYDLLRALNFDPRQHAIGTANGEILQGNDALYSKVSDGDKLLVTEQAKVGSPC